MNSWGWSPQPRKTPFDLLLTVLVGAAQRDGLNMVPGLSVVICLGSRLTVASFIHASEDRTNHQCCNKDSKTKAKQQGSKPYQSHLLSVHSTSCSVFLSLLELTLRTRRGNRVAAVLMLYSFISDFCSFVYRSRRNLCSLHFFWDLNALYTSFKLQQPSNIEAPPNQCYLFWERVHFGLDFAFVSLGAA